MLCLENQEKLVSLFTLLSFISFPQAIKSEENFSFDPNCSFQVYDNRSGSVSPFCFGCFHDRFTYFRIYNCTAIEIDRDTPFNPNDYQLPWAMRVTNWYLEKFESSNETNMVIEIEAKNLLFLETVDVIIWQDFAANESFITTKVHQTSLIFPEPSNYDLETNFSITLTNPISMESFWIELISHPNCYYSGVSIPYESSFGDGKTVYAENDPNDEILDEEKICPIPKYERPVVEGQEQNTDFEQMFEVRISESNSNNSLRSEVLALMIIFVMLTATILLTVIICTDKKSPQSIDIPDEADLARPRQIICGSHYAIISSKKQGLKFMGRLKQILGLKNISSSEIGQNHESTMHT